MAPSPHDDHVVDVTCALDFSQIPVKWRWIIRAIALPSAGIRGGAWHPQFLPVMYSLYVQTVLTSTYSITPGKIQMESLLKPFNEKTITHNPPPFFFGKFPFLEWKMHSTHKNKFISHFLSADLAEPSYFPAPEALLSLNISDAKLNHDLQE